MPREYYLPQKARGTEPIKPDGTDLVIYTYEGEGPRGPRYYAIGFAGKAQKPLFHEQYQSESSRKRAVEEYIESRRRLLVMKEKAREEKRGWQHNVQVGDIFYTSWGYDQTNIDFYEVVDVRGSIIVVREIDSVVVSSGAGSESVMAEPGDFIGPPTRVKVQKAGNQATFKIGTTYAHEWDGRPLHQTPSGWGH